MIMFQQLHVGNGNEPPHAPVKKSAKKPVKKPAKKGK
jgi:hypothetical protein